VLPEFLRFIGGRPIVGYYIDFDVRMLDKYILRYIEAKLPNRLIEVSSMYYALKYGGAPPGTVLDLRFASILSDLGIPSLEQHDAFNDALMTAMMYVQLNDMQKRGARIARTRAVHQEAPIGA
jgi:DNA polymerase-3 subunit epsilon